MIEFGAASDESGHGLFKDDGDTRALLAECSGPLNLVSKAAAFPVHASENTDHKVVGSDPWI